MEVSYATMIAMGTLVQRLGRDAQRYQAALAEAVNESAEWKRIADELKAERDAAKQEAVSARQDAVTRENKAKDTTDSDIEEMVNLRRKLGMVTPIERLKKPRQHPVKAGEYVKNDNGDVCQVHEVYAEEYLLNTGWTWAFENCTPCDPPEATHDTPAGKQAAESAVKREPKPGDKVRLVREPSHTDIPAMLPWSKAFGMPGDTAIVVIMAVPDKVPSGTIPVRTGMGRCFFWPISCIEIVEDAK